MSDGHFQTTLYPSSPYASGMKAGSARMRQQAEQAFIKWLQQQKPQLTTEEQNMALLQFKTLLNT